MHILFLTDNFPPEVNAPASRTFEHCREWAKAGHEITVITCAPNFPTGRVFEGYSNRLWHSETVEGIRVIRVWSYISRNEGFARRIADYTSYMVSALIASLFVRRVDVIVGTSPQFFTACAAVGASFCKRKPWIFELRDIWPESIREVGAMRKERVLDWLERLELFLYRKATRVVSVTHAFKRNLIERGIDAGKIDVVTNGVDIDRFTPVPKDSTLVAELSLQDKFVAGYIGTHGMAHALDTLLDAAALLKQSGVGDAYRILLLGDGANRQKLKHRAAAEGLDNVVFVDTVPKDQVTRYWSILDASIIHLRKSDLFKTVIPSKLFECMGMGIPVLHGVEGESADIVRSSGAGICFEPEDAQALCAAMIELRNDHELRMKLASNGPVAARQYDRKNLAAQMLQTLESVRRPRISA